MLSTLAREVELHGEAARSASGKGTMRQICEILRIRMQGFSPHDYYLLELHSRDATGYLGTLHYARLIRQLNPKQTGIVAFNKWVMSTFLRGAGLPVPRNHGVLNPRWGWRETGGPLRTEDDFRDLVSKLGRGIVCKPLDGSKGHGVWVIERYDGHCDVVHSPSGAEDPLAAAWTDLSRDPEGCLVQEQVQACATLHEVHPASLNTVRVTTLIDNEGNMRIVLAVFRMGAGDSSVDNMSSGGLACMIDIKSGYCGKAVSEKGPEAYSHHPDTGVALEGLLIPRWPEVLQLARRAHSVLPFPRCLSWDIAVTDDSPVLIEVNGHDPVAAFQKTGWRLSEGPLGKLIDIHRR